MDNCIFCKIGNGEIPSKKVYEDDKYLAFLDIRPMSEGHTLLIPKQHYTTFLDMPKDEEQDLFGKVQDLSKDLKSKLNSDHVFLLVMGEEVPHTHIHLIPYRSGESFPFNLNHKEGMDLDSVLQKLK